MANDRKVSVPFNADAARDAVRISFGPASLLGAFVGTGAFKLASFVA
jgi:hypothetical protein